MPGRETKFFAHAIVSVIGRQRDYLDCGGSGSADAALVEPDPVRNTNNTDRKNDGHNDVAGSQAATGMD